MLECDSKYKVKFAFVWQAKGTYVTLTSSSSKGEEVGKTRHSVNLRDVYKKIYK